jgi:glucuronate isomerase
MVFLTRGLLAPLAAPLATIRRPSGAELRTFGTKGITMSDALLQRLTTALAEIPLIDPHSHIDPHRPAARSLDEILGYHYYTELAHSAGMGHDPLRTKMDPRERVKAILEYTSRYDNTVQYSWFVEICQTCFGWQGDRIGPNDADALWNQAERQQSRPDWESEVLRQSNIEKVFLTNDFDDPLEGFDTTRYVPCLRTDDLVFKLHDPAVRQRLAEATGIEAGDSSSLRRALGRLFQHFIRRGAKACAISLPPGFQPTAAAEPFTPPAVFWMLAEACQEWKLPFDLMIGVNRRVYPQGVYQGQDLFDQRTSLIQYADLFNAFPDVTFCISVLTSSQNQELASYSWIFPNVVTCGHWWYANVPTLIDRDLRNRLQAVPKTKQIGYYSDAYKLEFILPKFNMYRRVLARVLAEDYVIERNWSEERAVELGRVILRDNVERIFQC